MANLPTSAEIVDSGVTNAQQKLNLADIVDFLLDLLGGDSSDKVAARAALGAAAIGDAVPPITGESRNLRASLTANGTSITFAADQIIVGASLSGSAMRLASYSQALNISTTGAGGMDVGAAPTSGFLAVYAIAKADGTKSILGVNAATSSGTIYSGANMPSGYTYSALIGIIPTNATPAMKAGFVGDRHYSYQAAQVILAAQTVPTTLTSQSLSVAVPSAAKAVDLIYGNVTNAAFNQFSVASDATGAGLQVFHSAQDSGLRTQVPTISNNAGAMTFKDQPLITAQTVFIQSNGAAAATDLYVSGYSF